MTNDSSIIDGWMAAAEDRWQDSQDEDDAPVVLSVRDKLRLGCLKTAHIHLQSAKTSVRAAVLDDDGYKEEGENLAHLIERVQQRLNALVSYMTPDEDECADDQ